MPPNSAPGLHKFIAAAKEHVASDESLGAVLENSGWPKTEIWRALGERYESLSGVPIPTGKKTSTPAKDAFLYLFVVLHARHMDHLSWLDLLFTD
jgi:hypothetical protein